MFGLPKTLSVRDYEGMPTRLAVIFFFASVILIYCLILSVHWVGAIGELSKPLAPIFEAFELDPRIAPAIIVAAIAAFLSHAVKLHDQISNVFGIRERFDLGAIVWPLAALSGAQLKPQHAQRFRQNRKPIMRHCFYKYASSTEEKPEVPVHEIIQALTNWSNIWATLEFSVLLLSAAVIWALDGDWAYSSACLFGIVFLATLRAHFLGDAERYAEAQVTFIAADSDRRTEVREYLEGL